MIRSGPTHNHVAHAYIILSQVILSLSALMESTGHQTTVSLRVEAALSIDYKSSISFSQLSLL